MDASHQHADAIERGEMSCEKPPLDETFEPSSSPFPSPTTTSSTGGSKQQSEAISDKSKLCQLYERLISFTSRANFEGTDLPPGAPGIVVRTLESCPEGYPNLAAFLDSDENFMLYRRFGYLQSRILLHKQDELRALEEQLDRLDRKDAADPKTRRLLQSRDLDDNSNSPRKSLLKTIETAYKEYAQLLTLAQQMVALNKPASRDYTSVKNYFDDEQPLCSDDEFYIYRKEDIITLKPGRESAWLDGVIEKILQTFTCAPIRYLFRSPETRRKSSGNTVYYTKSRIDTLVTFIITCVILILMVVPVYALWHLSILNPSGPDTTTTIGVLLVFTLIFSGVLSFFTRARRHEIFGAAAAYCAVLVVFISNVGQNAACVGH